MARKGPLLTLLGGGVLAGALLVANVAASDEGGGEADLAAGDAAPTTGAPAADPPPASAAPSLAPSAAPSAAPSLAPSPGLVEEVTTTYVGYVDGDDGASVAIVINGDEATAYVCDGEIEAWLDGQAANGRLELSGKYGELSATYDGEAATGETTAEGKTWTFTIEQVDPPEGLYRFADTILGGAEVRGGWIILPDGTQIGVLNVDGEARRTPKLDPETGEVTIDGTTVTTDRVG